MFECTFEICFRTKKDVSKMAQDDNEISLDMFGSIDDESEQTNDNTTNKSTPTLSDSSEPASELPTMSKNSSVQSENTESNFSNDSENNEISLDMFGAIDADSDSSDSVDGVSKSEDTVTTDTFTPVNVQNNQVNQNTQSQSDQDNQDNSDSNEISLDMFGTLDNNSDDADNVDLSAKTQVQQPVSTSSNIVSNRTVQSVQSKRKIHRKLTMEEQLRERDNSIFKNKPILDDDLIGLLLTKASDEQRNMEYKPFYDRFGNLAGYIPVPNQTLRR